MERKERTLTVDEEARLMEAYNNAALTTYKIYGAAAIKHALQKQKRVHGKDAHTSIADKPHANNKAAERRRRQMERNVTKD